MATKNRSGNVRRLLLSRFSIKPVKMADVPYYQNHWVEHVDREENVTRKAGNNHYFIANTTRSNKKGKLCIQSWGMSIMLNGNDVYLLGVDETGRLMRYKFNCSGIPNLMCFSLEEALRRCYDDYEQFLDGKYN